MPIAKEIIEKYKDHPYCLQNDVLLPISSNQKYNAYLKEVADICGINKNLTTHTARHTFATTVTLANGVPIETVSAMLGHKSIKTTQIYAKIVAEKSHPTHDTTSATLLGAYNTISGYLQNVRYYKTEDVKLKSILFGNGFNKIQSAFDLCGEFEKRGGTVCERN